MKGTMKVKELNKTGIYVSDIDRDTSFITRDNPCGDFILVITPLRGFSNWEIYFQKADDEYIIKGEGYCFASSKDVIEAEIAEFLSECNYTGVEHIEERII